MVGLPGLIVIHEWWGLNDNIKAMARRLAGEGFVVLAVDLYDGEVAETPNAAQALMAHVTAAPQAALDNLKQAYAYLDRYALAPRVASLGWCLGGTWSLQAALSLPTELDAMVMYYGQVVADEAQLATLKMPVLGLFGAEDASIPVASVQVFRAALNRLGKDADVRIYTGVGHAFANPSGGTYDAEAAEDAWQRTIAFLNRTMR
jgi:carboxymethylenebutenolidase